MIGWMRQGKHLDKDTEKVGYKEGETMPINEMRLNATVVLNNIKTHNFSIQDYPLSEFESEIVQKAIERFIDDLKFEQELKVY